MVVKLDKDAMFTISKMCFGILTSQNLEECQLGCSGTYIFNKSLNMGPNLFRTQAQWDQNGSGLGPEWDQMDRYPGSMGSNDPAPVPNGPKWVGTR